jgi:hypothetical protein
MKMRRALIFIGLIGLFARVASAFPESPFYSPSSSSGGTLAVGSTVSGGTVGSILYVGASSVLAQDNSGLFYDSTNHRLGLGTVSPSGFLHVYGSYGKVIFEGSDGNGQQTIFRRAGASDPIVMFWNNSSDFANWSLTMDGNEKMIWSDPNGVTNILTLLQSGNIGIGTASPATKLHLSSGVFTVDGTGAGVNINGSGGMAFSTTGSSATFNVSGGTFAFSGSRIEAPNGYNVMHATIPLSVCIASNSSTGFNGREYDIGPLSIQGTATILKVEAVALPTGTTVLFQLDERTLAAIGSAGSSVFTVTYASATSPGASYTSFSDAAIANGSHIVIKNPSTGASGGAPASCTVTIWYKED